MIFLFINSFVSFYMMSLVLKMGALRIQNDFFASTFVLGLLYLGYSRGCQSMINKTPEDRVQFMISAMSRIPFYGITLAILIEFFPPVAQAIDGIFNEQLLKPIGKEIVAASGFLSLARLGALSSVEMIGLYEIYGKDKTQKVISLSYMGALLASILAAFISFRQDNFLIHFSILVSINILVASFFLARFGGPRKSKIFNVLVLVISAFLVFRAVQKNDFFKLTSRAILYSQKNFPSSWSFSYKPQVESFTSSFQRLDLVRFTKPKEYFHLYLNEDFQFDSESHSLYHKPFVEGSLYFNSSGTPLKKVLILGGGDGLLATELINVLGPEISITLVELDPLVWETAQKRWPQLLSKNIDQQVQIIFGDAFGFLRESHLVFDAIFMDFPDPKSFDTGKLYSIEMYKMAKARLAPAGFLMLNYSSSNAPEVIYSTLVASGFKNVVAFGKGNSFFFANLQSTSKNFEDEIKASSFTINPVREFNPKKINSVFKPLLPVLNLTE